MEIRRITKLKFNMAPSSTGLGHFAFTKKKAEFDSPWGQS